MLYIDIDGVLNDYPESFINYLSDGNGKNFDTLFEAKINIPYGDYVAMRNGYRSDVEPYLRANKEIISVLNKSPYENIVVTKRPIHQISHLTNTMHWLKKSGLRYQHLVYWNKDIKDINIPFEVNYCKAAIEDNIKIASLLNKTFGIPVFVIANESNKDHMEEIDSPGIKYGSVEALNAFLRSF